MKKEGVGEMIMRVLEEQKARCLDSEIDRLQVAIALLEGIKQPIADIISAPFEK